MLESRRYTPAVRLLIVKTGSTIEPLRARRGDFEAWFREGLELGEREAPVVAPFEGEKLPEARAVPAALVTGSPAMVTEQEPWSVATERWLREFVRTGRPLLCVCYGHQLLAQALGGRVDYNPAGSELCTVRVELTEAGRRSPVFAGLPGELAVHASHSQSVLELPPGATLLARNAHDAHQAFAVGARAFSVQFHPEFDADILRGYAAERAEGARAQDIASAARDSEHGRAILARFRELLPPEGRSGSA